MKFIIKRETNKIMDVKLLTVAFFTALQCGKKQNGHVKRMLHSTSYQRVIKLNRQRSISRG